MVSQAGYKMKSADIDLNQFQIERNSCVELEARIFRFGCEITSEKAFAQIAVEDKANPWHPAKTEHLIAYRRDNKEPFPLLGLGYTNHTVGHRRVACLRGNALYFLWWIFDWDEEYAFFCNSTQERIS